MNALLTGLWQMCQEEMHQISEASKTSQENVYNQLTRLGTELKLISEQVIEKAFVTSSDIAPDNLGTTIDKVRRYVAAGMESAGQILAEMIQTESQKDLATEVNRLYVFATTVDRLIQHVERQLTNKTPGSKESLVEQFGQIWSEYRNGGEGSRSTIYGAGLLTAALGIPVLRNAVLTLKIPHISGQISVEEFKQNFQKAVREEIDKHLRSDRTKIRHAVDDHITDLFNGIKCKLDRFFDEHQSELEALPTSAFLTPSPYVAPILPTPASQSSAELLPTENAEKESPGKEFVSDVVIVDEQGRETNRVRSKAMQKTEELGKSVVLEMVYIPGGTFLMGSPNSEKSHQDNESPQHEVTIAPFYMGKFLVTQQQWEVIMGTNPSTFKGEKRPVDNITWYEAMEFCKRLSEKTGRTYRLPSESEWEYACRAGTTTPFCFGEVLTAKLANHDGRSMDASGENAYFGETTDVGRFPPNAFGLYDMHGNGWEWCADLWHENYEGAPSDGRVWESGEDVSYRVLRGGSWLNDPWYCRSARRSKGAPNNKLDFYCFRVVVTSSL